MSAGSFPHRYSSLGLTFASGLELPELPPAQADAAADIDIDIASLAAVLDGISIDTGNVQVAGGIYQFLIPRVARYRVEAGRRISVDPEPGADPGAVRVFLLGHALSVLLFQRGLTPLHVSVIATPAGAVAFAGRSGAGKSTLATALYRLGYPLMSDDLAVARLDGEGQAWVYPGFPRLKLWRDTLEHLGLSDHPKQRDIARAEKYHLPVESSFRNAPSRLLAFFVLERGEDSESARVIRLSKLEAIRAIEANIFFPSLANVIGERSRCFQDCATLAARLPVFRYRRPWRLEALTDSLAPMLAAIPS